MTFDYFYEEQADQFTFYRIPKLLFTGEQFQGISTDAKVLYGLLLDRVSLSTKNEWLDGQGRVFIIFTISSVQKELGCGDKKATRLLVELENYGLIERVKQGQGKPAVIYVKNFILPSQQRFKTRQNNDSRGAKITIQDSSKQRCNNTEFSNTDYSNTNLIVSDDIEMEEREGYRSYFMEQLGIEYLKNDFPYEKEIIDGILELILDTVCLKRKTIRIAGDNMSLNVVKSRFMKLENSHIQYVMACMRENTTKVRSIKQYMLATLYNAPVTIGSYYQSLVNNDMATGKI